MAAAGAPTPTAAAAQAPATSKAALRASGGDEKQQLARLTYANGWGHEAKPAFAPFNAWVARYLGASDDAKAAMVAEGVALAETRANAMKELIQKDPKEAIASTVPASLLGQLPPPILSHLEKRVSNLGNLNVSVACLTNEAAKLVTGDLVSRQVVFDQQKYKAFTYGRRSAEGTKYNIPLHGVAMGNLLAVHESPIRVLEAGETPAADRTMVNAPAAGSSAVALQIEVGRFAMTSIAIAQALELQSNLVAAEAKPGPYVQPMGLAAQLFPSLAAATSVPWTTGTQRVLIIRVDFSDLPGAVISQGDAQNVMDSSVKPFYEQNSFGHDTIVTTVTPKTYRMPSTAVAYATGYDANIADADLSSFIDVIHTDAEPLALVDYPDMLDPNKPGGFDRIGVVFTYLGNIVGSQVTGLAGISNIDGPRFSINGECDLRVLAHELGHSYGLYHANLWQVSAGDDANSDFGYSLGYGDAFDMMGGNPNGLGVDFGASRKLALEWIDPSTILSATSSGIYRVYRLDSDTPASQGNTMGVTVARADAQRSYWIEYRNKNIAGSNLATSAYIVWQDDVDGLNGNLAGYTNLLDCTTPGTNVSDAGLGVGASLTDFNSGMTITPLSTGGSFPNQYIDVQVSFGNSVGFVTTDYTVQESDGSVLLTVNRTGDGVGAIKVDYTTSNGSAQAPDAYTAIAGTLSWNSGDMTTRTITVKLKPGYVVNGQAAFYVLLTNPVGGYIDSDTATVRILDPGAVDTTFVPTVPMPAPSIAPGTPVVTGTGTVSVGTITIPVVIPNNGAGLVLTGSFVSSSGSTNFIGPVKIVSATTTGSAQGSVNQVILQPDDTVLAASEDTVNLSGTAFLTGTNTQFQAITGTASSVITGTSVLRVNKSTTFTGQVFPTPRTIFITGTALSTGTNFFVGTRTLTAATPFSGTTVLTGTQTIRGKTWIKGSNFTVVTTGTATYRGILTVSGSCNEVVRLLSDGSQDSAFNGTGAVYFSGSAGGMIRSMALEADGSILVGGNFGIVGTTAINRIARLSQGGTLDTTFNPGANGPVLALAVQPDARILVGGAFTTASGTGANLVARLNPNGSRDASFTSPLITGSAFVGLESVNSIALQPDNSILLGGKFVSGTTSGIIRALSSGTLDAGFSAGTGAYLVNSGTLQAAIKAIALQPDGKILIGGGFNSINGQPHARLARLQADGSLDSTFVPSFSGGGRAEVNAIAVDGYGGIFVAGEFTLVNTAAVNRLAKLRVSGTLDTSYYVGSGVSNTVNSLSLAGNGKFAIGASVDASVVGDPTVQGFSDLPVALFLGQAPSAGQVQLDKATYSGYSGSTLQVLVQRTGGSKGPISVNYSTVDGDAVSGVNYSGTSGTLTWPDGNNTDKIINIPLFGGQVKSFSIKLAIPIGGTQAGAPLASSWAYASSKISILTGNRVPSTPTNLSPVDGATQQPLAVTLKASAFSDTADTHFASQWLVWRVSDGVVILNKTLTIFDTADLTSLSLTNELQTGVEYRWSVRYEDSHAPQGAWSLFSASTSFTTHLPLVFSFSAPAFFVPEGPAPQIATIVITRDVLSPDTNTVTWSTRDGTARNGIEYTGSTGILTFTGTESSKSVQVAIIDNNYPSGNTTFYVDLSTPTGGATIQTPGSVQVVIQDNEVPSFSSFSGKYHGLIGNAPPATNLTAGYISLSMDSGGAFSATIQYGGQTYHVKGRLQAYGLFVGVIPGTNLTLTLQLDMSGKDLFSGSISDGVNPAVPLTADRAVFDAKRYPASQQGTYTMLISGTQTATNTPQGMGYGTLHLDGNGQGRFSGVLGDGTKASQQLYISKSGGWALYVPLYGNTGSIAGDLVFGGTTVAFDHQVVNCDVYGHLSWFNPINRDKNFPIAFEVHPTLMGARYAAPPKDTKVLPYPDTQLNTKFIIRGDALNPPKDLGITWHTNNKVDSFAINLANPSGSPEQFKMSITPSSGLFNGSFFEYSTGKMKKYNGVFVQKANIGGGYYFGNWGGTYPIKVEQNQPAP